MVTWHIRELTLEWTGSVMCFWTPQMKGLIYPWDGKFKIYRGVQAMMDGRMTEMFVVEFILSPEDTTRYLEDISNTSAGMRS